MTEGCFPRVAGTSRRKPGRGRSSRSPTPNFVSLRTNSSSNLQHIKPEDLSPRSPGRCSVSLRAPLNQIARPRRALLGAAVSGADSATSDAAALRPAFSASAFTVSSAAASLNFSFRPPAGDLGVSYVSQYF